MSKLATIIALLLAAFLETSVAQPSWVKSRSSPNYPDRLYMIGVGFANKTKDRAADLQKAYDAAFADIAKQIKSTVASQTSLHEYEVLSGNNNSLEQKTSAEIKVSTEVKLGGLKVVDTYEDDDNDLVWALAVLNRTSAGDQLKETLQGYWFSYSSGMVGSKRDLSSGNLYQSLLGLTDALKNEVRYNSIVPIYRFITDPLAAIDSSYLMPGTILMSDMKTVAQSCFSNLKIEKASGDTQSVSLQEGIKPLLLKVAYSGGESNVAESGVKFKFAFKNGGGKLTDNSTTDKTGMARCDVFSLAPTRDNIYTIEASMDLSEFKIAGQQFAATEFQDWNDFLDKNENTVLFTLKRSGSTLEDRLTDAVLLLSTKISDPTSTISVSRILYQDKLPGPMAEFLRQHIESTIQSATSLSVISEEAVRYSQMQLSEAGSQQNLSQPDYASGAAGAKYIVAGNYWKDGDDLDVSLKAIDVGSHVIVGSASADLPLSWLPKVQLAPENYNPVKDESLIKVEKKGEDLKVDVWVDRPDGIYHEGDTMSIYVRTNRDCYVQLVYNDAGGNTVLVFPNKVSWNSQVRSGTVYKVPGTFVMRPPFGREILKAYASDSPAPVPQGQELSGLILLNSVNDFQKSARSSGLSGNSYSESSIILTTMAKINYGVEQ